jgi:hypothetical protein
LNSAPERKLAAYNADIFFQLNSNKNETNLELAAMHKTDFAGMHTIWDFLCAAFKHKVHFNK